MVDKNAKNLAIIDLGSNTAILLIFQNSPLFKVIHEEYRSPRLSQGLRHGGPINLDALSRTCDDLKQLNEIISDYQATLVSCAGTAPFRKVDAPKKLIDNIFERTGIRVTILSQMQEAYASYLAALQVPTSAATLPQVGHALVMDIGGGSCELCWGLLDQMSGYHSVAQGCVDLTECYLPEQLNPHGCSTSANMEALRQAFVRQLPKISLQPSTLMYAVAGTPVSVALLEAKIYRHQPHLVDGARLTLQMLDAWQQRLATTSLEEKISHYGIPAGRAGVLLAGIIVLSATMRYFGLSEVIARNSGLRHGLALQCKNAG